MSRNPLRLPTAAVLAVALGGACSAAQAPPPGPSEVLAPETPVEVDAPSVNVPDPTARERWESPFAVSGVGRAVVRPPRDVLILGADSAIAAGLARREAASRPGAVATRTESGRGTEPAPGPAGANVRTQPDPPPTGSGREARPASTQSESASRTDPATGPTAGARPVPAPTGSAGEGSASAPGASAGRPGSDPAPTGPSTRNPPAPAPTGPARGAGAASAQPESPTRVGVGTVPTAPGSASGRGVVVLLGEDAGETAAAARATAGTPATGGGGTEGSRVAAADVPGERMALHVVEAGENWSRIVIRYRVSSQALAAANPGVEPNLIRTGQILNIPIPDSSPVSRSHRVGPGETLRGIATRYNVTADEIRRLNSMEDERVTMGETLLIPAARGAEGDGR